MTTTAPEYRDARRRLAWAAVGATLLLALAGCASTPAGQAGGSPGHRDRIRRDRGPQARPHPHGTGDRLLRAGQDQRRARRAQAGDRIRSDLPRRLQPARPDLHAPERLAARPKTVSAARSRSIRATPTRSTTTAGCCASRAATTTRSARSTRRWRTLSMRDGAKTLMTQGLCQAQAGRMAEAERSLASAPTRWTRATRSPATTWPTCCTSAATRAGPVLHPAPEQQPSWPMPKRCGWASRSNTA